MNRRHLLTRALAALASLPLLGKAEAAEAAEAAPDAASECAAQGGDFAPLSADGYSWVCTLAPATAPAPAVWGFVTDYYPDSDMLDYSTTRYEWVPRSAFH